jgi:ribonucleoside-diphosphate reductase alpha chain
MSMERIRKRDGSFQAFESAKIAQAVRAAMRALGREDAVRAERLAGRVVELLAAAGGTPTVEQAQDLVERVLVEDKDPDLAKAYILYRSRHASLRETKTAMGVHDDLKLSLNAVRVLEKRYLRRDETGRVCETPAEMFRRVAEAVAAVEERYEGPEAARASAERFYRLMASLEFLPNSPTLMNAGTELGQLSACFVLPVEDSMDGIFSALRNMAFIHQSGGGTGFNFSRLRPAGDVVKSTGGVASGPISFIEVFDKATDVIRQGGRRRGANMAMLDVGHADALDFILCKTRPGFLTNFNISLAATDAFMRAVREDAPHEFRNPRTGRVVDRRPAREVFEMVCAAAWQCGDPGMVFIDTINAANPLRDVALIEATNPCGEEPLLPYESCNLGSINLTRFLRDGRFDFDRLGRVVEEAVRFLDDVIDANRYPIPEIERATRASRKIGLGVMGFADALYLMGVPYDSDDGLRAAEEVMRFVNLRARETSIALGRTRGPFPLFDRSDWKRRGLPALRNATVTTLAPTGTIGLIAGVSSGIEPVFALRYWRTMAEGATLFETHPEFARRCEAAGADLEELFSGCGRQGSVRDCEHLPAALRRVFATARDIAPERHVRMQAAFQRHTDNGVSKTINLPRSATIEDVRRAYLLAHELGCKGITVYREGSKESEVLRAGAPTAEKLPQLNAESCDPRDGTCRRCPV